MSHLGVMIQDERDIANRIKYSTNVKKSKSTVGMGVPITNTGGQKMHYVFRAADNENQTEGKKRMIRK